MLRLAKFDEEFRKKKRRTLTHTDSPHKDNSTELFCVSAQNYSLSNKPEERSNQLPRGGSLKSRTPRQRKDLRIFLYFS